MEEKIRFSVTDLSIEILSENYDFSEFECGVPALDYFFHNNIWMCVKYKYVSAYLVKYLGAVVAIFTLAHDTIAFLSDEEKADFFEEMLLYVGDEYKDIFVQQTDFPSINIGHLATRKDMQNKGIGSFVINSILETFISYGMAGCQFVTVDSLNNPETNKFYQKNGFRFYTDNDTYRPTRRMFLPLNLFGF